jgi:polyphenol oxidase
MAPALPADVATVRETPSGDGPPLFTVPAWTERFPWLVHGTTGAGPGGDFRLFGEAPRAEARDRWERLRERLGMERTVHSRQVHGSLVHGGAGRHGGAGDRLVVLEGYDGHATGEPGTLLTVSLADCAPISLVDPERRRVALLHGGWRGTAAGIVETGLDALGADPERVVAHIGPAICGACYEVGPEVFEALGLDAPAGPAPVDLRAAQARRLVEAGVRAEAVAVSAWCTLCDDGFYSHRGGASERQLGVLGRRADA